MTLLPAPCWTALHTNARHMHIQRAGPLQSAYLECCASVCHLPRARSALCAAGRCAAACVGGAIVRRGARERGPPGALGPRTPGEGDPGRRNGRGLHAHACMVNICLIGLTTFACVFVCVCGLMHEACKSWAAIAQDEQLLCF